MRISLSDAERGPERPEPPAAMARGIDWVVAAVSTLPFLLAIAAGWLLGGLP